MRMAVQRRTGEFRMERITNLQLTRKPAVALESVFRWCGLCSSGPRGAMHRLEVACTAHPHVLLEGFFSAGSVIFAPLSGARRRR